MESVYRSIIIYFFLMLLLRISGKRTLAEITVFDFVLILIIGDASQQSITGPDYSIVNALIIVGTLILLDTMLSFIKSRFRKVERVMDGSPLILLKDGECIKPNLNITGVDEEDILEAARRDHGLENMKQIKYAILEKDGGIYIIPESKKA